MAIYKRSTYNFLTSVQELVERHNLIKAEDRIICALSGGLDSVMLFHFLLFYREQVNFKLSACHLHHSMRAETAERDAKFVKKLCQEEKVVLHFSQVDVPKLAEKNGLSLEEAGRKARYDFFQRLIDDYKIKEDRPCRIALGHHADDAVESFVMNLGRGAANRGASIMRLSDEYIIRPLLSTPVEELHAVAIEENIKWCEDESNRSDEFLRNRIRNKLLPYWSEILGYNVRPILFRYAESAREDEIFLDKLAQGALQSAMLTDGSLSTAYLADLSPVIQKRLLLIYLERYYKDKLDIDQPNINRAQLEALSRSIKMTAKVDGITRYHSLPFKQKAEVSKARLFLLNKD